MNRRIDVEAKAEVTLLMRLEYRTQAAHGVYEVP
jgi:hypothetical protein